LPPVVIGLFSATYAILTIITFHKNHSQFKAFLSEGNITSNRFIRLMCLASFEILFNIPIALYGISLQAQTPLNPYISWENVHFDFSHVQEIPSLIWRSVRSEEIAIELSRWTVVFCAFGFFIFFGFADEARKNYRFAFQSVTKRLGLSTGTGYSFGNGINSSDFVGTNRYVNQSYGYGDAFLSR
jgi:pheromone a factor receptor